MITTIAKILESQLAGYTALPVIYDATNNTSGKEFVRATLEQANSQTTTIGSTARPEKMLGYFTLQVFTLVGQGAGRARAQGDALAALYRNRKFKDGATTVEIYGVDFLPQGERNGVFQLNITIAFQAITQMTVPPYAP